MKKYLILLFSTLSSMLIAQSGMSYQSVVRNASGLPLSNTTVFLKFEITDIVSGTSLYAETQDPITDIYGWFNVVIGIGTTLSGNFSTIDWTSGSKKLIVSCAPMSGGVYTNFSSSVINNSPFIGAKGEKGDQGIQGIQGIQGLQGDRGDKGDKGDQGIQGIQGLQGEKGDTGLPGVKGDKGDAGIQGLQGEKGEKGDMGLKGDKGDSGSANAWELLGNAGTNSATHFVGTIDNVSLAFRVNNNEEMKLSTDGLKVNKAIVFNGGVMSGPLKVEAPINITNFQHIEFGSGTVKESNAGKIAYQLLSPDALEIFGAGTTIANRKIRMFAKGGTLFEGGGSFNGKLNIQDDALAPIAGDLKWNSSASDFEGYNGTSWKSLTNGLTLPYFSNYGSAIPSAFRIDIQSDNIGIELNQLSLASTKPALFLNSVGRTALEVESTNADSANTSVRIFNNNTMNRGTLLRLENEGNGLALVAHSHSGRAAIIDGSTGKDTATIDIYNLGIGNGLVINHPNPSGTNSGLIVKSSTKGSAAIIENSKNTNPPGAVGLELKNGYLKVDQNSVTRTAYIHNTNINNISSNLTVLSYPNMQGTDMILVTHRYRGAYITAPVGVWWNGTAWTIFTEDNSAMPINENFNVFIIKQ